jgi:multiple sugar transport system permease protein
MKRLSFQTRYKLIGYQFLIPTFLVLLLVVAMPLLFSLVLSLNRYTFLSPRLNEFVGLKNYASVIHDQYFWNSVKVTVWFVAMVVPLEFLIGYGIALMLSRPEIKFKSIFYFILTVPMVMSPVAVGLIWRMLLHPELGVVNYILGKLGFGYVNWFGDQRLALFTVTLVDIWQQVSFMVLLLLSGITSLPKEPFESAMIDGANWFQNLLFVKTPLLMPIITVAILQRVITSFKTYDLVYVLTSGGPGVSTDLISYNIYRTTFMGLDLSVASAVSYMLLFVILAITVVIFRSTMKGNE